MRALLFFPFFYVAALHAQLSEESLYVAIDGVVQTCGQNDSISSLYYEITAFNTAESDSSGKEDSVLASGYFSINPNGIIEDTLSVRVPNGVDKLVLGILLPYSGEIFQTFAYVNEPSFYFDLSICDEPKCTVIFEAAAEPGRPGVEFDVKWNGEAYPYNDSSLNMLWDFGDGTTSSWPYHLYEEPGMYTICLTVSDSSCQDTYCEKVYVYGGADTTQECKAEFHYEFLSASKVSFRPKYLVTKTDSVGVRWAIFDGQKEINRYTPEVTYDFTSTGEKLVCLTSYANDESCTSCDTLFIEGVDTSCTQKFVPYFQTGEGLSVYFGLDPLTNDSLYENSIAIRWDFGDSTYSEESRPVHTYEEGGKYLVKVSITFDDCTFEYVLEVHIESGVCPKIYDPYWNAGQDNEVYFGITGYYTQDDSLPADSLGLLIEWDFGDGKGSGDPFPIHTYESPGKYEVTVWILDQINGCEYAYTFYVRVEGEEVVCTADFDIFLISENQVKLKALQARKEGVKTRYRWTFSDGTTANGRKITYEFSQPGWYEVCLNVQVGESCIVENCDSVFIDFEPVCHAGFKYQVEGMTLALAALSNDSVSSPAKYLWDLGDGISKEGDPISYTYEKPGAYLVCLKAFQDANSGCFECKEIIIKPDFLPEDSLIYGKVTGDLDLNQLDLEPSRVFLSLMDQELEAVAYTGLGKDLAYQFENIPFGNYRLRVISYESAAVLDERTISLDPVQQPEAEVDFMFQSTSVDPARDMAFMVYPNPSVGQVNLRLTVDNSQEAHIEVRDLLGRLYVKEAWRLAAGMQEKELSLGQLSKGVYTILINTDQGPIYRFIELK